MAFLDTGLEAQTLKENESTCVEVNHAKVGLFRTADGLFAIDDVCPHRGAPLHDGFFREGVVTCPWHQWNFQLRDGVCANVPNVRVAAYPTEERNGTIWVDLEAGKAGA